MCCALLKVSGLHEIAGVGAAIIGPDLNTRPQEGDTSTNADADAALLQAAARPESVQQSALPAV